MKWLLKHKLHGNKPWDVQRAALERAAGRERFGYHLEQGLGKTALVFNEFLNSDAQLMIVAVPNSFKGDWALVPEEWGWPQVAGSAWPDVGRVSGSKTLFAINYEALRTSGGEYVRKLMKSLHVFFVIDESSAIKNPRSQTARAVMELAKDAYIVRELNGTPLVQNCMDLFAPLKCLGELNGVNPFQFRNRFAVMGGYMGKVIKGLKNEDELYAILNACSFRALKTDWRDLPPKIYSTVHLEMTARQRRHYGEMLEEFFTQVDGLEVSADMVLTQLDKLRQIASCIVMQDGRAGMFEDPAKNPKLQATLDIIDGGQTKVIVTHFYKASGQMLLSELMRRGLNPARLRGGMTSDEILVEKKRFNDDPTCRVLVGQESKTARGHTLIGGAGNDRATRMIFFEQSFSLMERLQIEDRIHRGDQDQACQYFDLVTSPIDQAIIDALRTKKSMADMVDAVVKSVRKSVRA